MGLSKPVGDWSAVIGEAAELFMNGTIEIFDPKVPTTKVYSGKARIQHLRRPEIVNGSYEWSAYRNFRFQIPLKDAPSTLKAGLRVKITGGGKDPALVGSFYRVESVKNSSHAAVRTIEAVGE